MKTILVPIGGGDGDRAVMETALAAAAPLSAHLEFLHVRLSAGDAAHHTPHVDFARGPAIHNALAELEADAATRSANAKRHVVEFCKRARLKTSDLPHASHSVTARWHEEDGDGLERLLFHARHHDLTVLARRRKNDGIAPDRLERLLVESGRPLLIAPAGEAGPLLDCVVVCWKERACAARALTAAMPLLTAAKAIHFVAVEEGGDVRPGLDDVVRQLGWYGIAAEASVIEPRGRSTVDALRVFARECNAGLIVMGGYGHSRTREMMFGGCTQAMMERGDRGPDGALNGRLRSST